MFDVTTLGCNLTMPRRNRKTKTQKYGNYMVCKQCHARPRANKSRYCETCSKIKKENTIKRNLALINAGRCTKCRQPLNPPEFDFNFKVHIESYWAVCPVCFFKRSASRNLEDASRWTELAELFIEQEGRCVYLGTELILNKTASLDHRIARVNKGTNDYDNLQWVEKAVNMAKHTLGHEEFITLCWRIVRADAKVHWSEFFGKRA